jgi:hypothetical protein
MSAAASFGLSVLALFVLPVLVSGCLADGRGGVPWYEARRDPTGLAPDPATTPEAVVQVYAARAVSWRGVFSVRTWIAVKPTGLSDTQGMRCLVLASPTAPRRSASTVRDLWDSGW